MQRRKYWLCAGPAVSRETHTWHNSIQSEPLLGRSRALHWRWLACWSEWVHAILSGCRHFHYLQIMVVMVSSVAVICNYSDSMSPSYIQRSPNKSCIRSIAKSMAKNPCTELFWPTTQSLHELLYLCFYQHLLAYLRMSKIPILTEMPKDLSQSTMRTSCNHWRAKVTALIVSFTISHSMAWFIDWLAVAQ